MNNFPLISSYEEAVDWLFQQFPAYQNQGQNAYKPGLDNVKQLIDELNIDLSKLKFVHIAGTNGKGTVTNYLGSIFIESGYKTGIFTSPHILDFRERIVVNGEGISSDFVVNFCRGLQHISVQPSFFEISFAMAMQYFIEKGCQYAILETGLGGRLDATNVVMPLLTIITNIGFDHMQFLGNTLPKIAFEKAGIIKPNVPIIIGEFHEETFPVFEKTANERNAPLFLAEDRSVSHSHFKLDNFKRKNEKSILLAVEKLREMGIALPDDAVERGFVNISKNTSYKGRFEVVSEKPLEIVDVAHNEDGIRDLVHSIAQLKYKNLFIIYGCSSDKKFEAILRLFPQEAQLFFTEFSNPRSLKMEIAREKMIKARPEMKFFKNISDAQKYVENVRNQDDVTIVVGSFFLASDFFSTFF